MAPVEVLQVVLLTASAAAHATHELGLSILTEEMPGAIPASTDPGDAARREAYIAATGSWSPVGDAVQSLSPEFAEGFLSYRQSAWEAGPLPDKTKALILLASPATLNRDGTRLNMCDAIRFGASPGEITEVLQLASAIAVHTCTYGVLALMDAVAAQETQRAPGEQGIPHRP